MAYDPAKEQLAENERAIAKALYDIAGTAYHEYFTDEDPGVIDTDDVLEILMKVPGAAVTLVTELGRSYKDPKVLEGAAHGLARQFLV